MTTWDEEYSHLYFVKKQMSIFPDMSNFSFNLKYQLKPSHNDIFLDICRCSIILRVMDYIPKIVKSQRMFVNIIMGNVWKLGEKYVS